MSIITLLEDTCKSLRVFGETFGVSTWKLYPKVDHLSDSEIEEFLRWVCQGKVETEYKGRRTKTEESRFSITVERDLVWFYLGGVTIPPIRKSRARTNWMAKALCHIVESSMKEAEEQKTGYARRNAKLLYCLENHLIPQEQEQRIVRILEEYS